jgi:hypothetical protein
MLKGKGAAPSHHRRLQHVLRYDSGLADVRDFLLASPLPQRSRFTLHFFEPQMSHHLASPLTRRYMIECIYMISQ